MLFVATAEPLLTGAVIGAVFGALITGSLKIVGDLIARRNASAALAHGFAAEIRAGLARIPDTPSDEEARSLASDGLPYEFYNGNRDKIGLIGAMKAEKVVSYYSLRWQLYKAGQTLDSALGKPDGIDVSSATKRVQKLLSDTRASASSAVDDLHKS
jgi:hypothetical protein